VIKVENSSDTNVSVAMKNADTTPSYNGPPPHGTVPTNTFAGGTESECGEEKMEEVIAFKGIDVLLSLTGVLSQFYRYKDLDRAAHTELGPICIMMLGIYKFLHETKLLEDEIRLILSSSSRRAHPQAAFFAKLTNYVLRASDSYFLSPNTVFLNGTIVFVHFS
jgi:hypothetical protein